VRTVGLLPAAGMATRMRGLPKFLLPLADDRGSLLEYHVQLLEPYVDALVIPTRPEWIGVLQGFGWSDTVSLVELSTDTLAHTAIEALQDLHYDQCVVGLPDTVFSGGNPYAELAERYPGDPLVLACFPTRDHQRGKLGSIDLSPEGVVVHHADKPADGGWPQHWGALRLTPEVLSLLSPDQPTVGNVIDECLARGITVRGFVHEGDYFDCGTVEEYARCLHHQVTGA